MMENQMIEKFQEVNKRRQDDDMCITPLVMFAEAWESRQAEIDELQKRIDEAIKVLEESPESALDQIEKIYGALKGEQND